MGSGATKDVDAYLARLPAGQREALAKLRRTIRAAAPAAVEAMSYGIVGYKVDGRPVIYLGAAKAHLAIYGPVVSTAGKDLQRFDRSKGTLRFTPDRPIPAAAVTTLVKARVAAIRSGTR